MSTQDLRDPLGRGDGALLNPSVGAQHRARAGVGEVVVCRGLVHGPTLLELLSAMADSGHAPEVAGICVDATSLTLVPLDKNGKKDGGFCNS